MSDTFDDLPDRAGEKVEEQLRDGARLAYLGEPPEARCFECGEVVNVEHAYSGIDPKTGRRGYICPACNFDPIHDQA